MRSSPFRPIKKASTRVVIGKTLDAYIKDCERSYIVDALIAARGNMTQAAFLLGRNRTELYRKMAACGIVLIKRNIK